MNVPGLRFLLEREVRNNAIEARATRAARRRIRRRRRPRLPLNTDGQILAGRKRETVDLRIPKSQEKRNRRAALWRTLLMHTERDRAGETEQSPSAKDRAGRARESPSAKDRAGSAQGEPSANDRAAKTPYNMFEGPSAKDRAGRAHGSTGRPSVAPGGGIRSLVAWCMRLPRTLRALPTAFGRFYMSSMLPNDGAREGSTDLYPCPLPYLWTCGKPPRGGHARARWAQSWALRFWVNSCVLALNYFALGMPSWCPTGARFGSRRSAAQATMVRSVEARCRAMLREPLPWDSGKIIHAHEATQVVARLMRGADIDGAAYYQQTDRSLGNFGRADGPARQVVASRVALPSSPPFFDPGPHLERAGATRAAQVYANPAEGELPCAAEPVRRGELRRCCLLNSSEERLLAGRMDAAGMLGLVPAADISRPGGLFGVDKKRDPNTGEMSLRLIFDRRPRNAVEVPLRDLCRTLAQGVVLCDLLLEAREEVRIWLSDLPNYYYTFRVSSDRMKTNAWGNPITRSEAMAHPNAWTSLEGREEANGDWFYRAANTLPMGDTNAVEFGQGAHVGMLLGAGGMQPGEALEAAKPGPRGRVWQGVVVDDHAIIARVCPATGGAAVQRARELWASAQEAYTAEGLTPVPEKCIVEASAGRVWGAWLDGRLGTVGVPRARRAELGMVSLDVAALGWGSRGMRRQLTGLWVHPILYRRELLCTLDRVFDGMGSSDSEDSSEGAVTQLSSAQRDELALLSLLSPMMETNLRAPVALQLCTSDASPDGAGGTVATVSQPVANEMWRHRERRGFSAALEQYWALYQKSTGREEAPESDFAPNREWVSELIAGLSHRTFQQFKFTSRHHINVGEMRARRALLRRLAVQRACAGTRRLVAYDSRVTIGVAAKGRSPSRALNYEQRRTMPYLVGPDIQEGPLWVDSKRNPSDHPSRGRPLPAGIAAVPWVQRFLKGDLGALDARLKVV